MSPVSGVTSSTTDNAVSGENRAFTYDALGRLSTASGPWGSGSYTYDLLGNLRSWTQGSSTHTTVWDTAKNRPSSATTTGLGTRAFVYDARGNTSGLGGMGFTYDFSNQPTWIGGSGVTDTLHTYDGNLKRVKSASGAGTLYTAYSTLTGKVSVLDNATTGEQQAIIHLGPASVRWNPASGAEITLLDHLGSPAASTNWGGSLLWRESYTPFGDKRLDPAANRDKPSFTGHIDDAATGLTYMQARYYDPALGRFLSTDPIGYHDQLNLYAYVANDPVNKWDPEGLCKVDGNKIAECEVKFDRGVAKSTQRAISRELVKMGKAIEKSGSAELKESWAATKSITFSSQSNPAASSSLGESDVQTFEDGSGTAPRRIDITVYKPSLEEQSEQHPSGTQAIATVGNEIGHGLRSTIALDTRFKVLPQGFAKDRAFERMENSAEGVVSFLRKQGVLPQNYIPLEYQH